MNNLQRMIPSFCVSSNYYPMRLAFLLVFDFSLREKTTQQDICSKHFQTTHTSATAGIRKPLLSDLDAEKDSKAHQNKQQAAEHGKSPCDILEKIKNKL